MRSVSPSEIEVYLRCREEHRLAWVEGWRAEVMLTGYDARWSDGRLCDFWKTCTGGEEPTGDRFVKITRRG